MPRILNRDLEIYYFEITSTSRSFFGILSKETNSSILLNISPLPYENEYLVFAYTYSDIKDYVKKIYMRYRSDGERYIKSLRAYRINRGTLIIAVKEACPFIEIALKHNVTIVSPYTFDKGVRKYLVVGTPDNINEYTLHVMERYGGDNIFVEKVRGAERLKNFIAIQTPNILDKLTGRELEVLKKAYELGVFDYPRRTDLNSLSEELRISKVTASILIRKSLKKIIEEIFSSAIK